MPSFRTDKYYRQTNSTRRRSTQSTSSLSTCRTSESSPLSLDLPSSESLRDATSSTNGASTAHSNTNTNGYESKSFNGIISENSDIDGGADGWIGSGNRWKWSKTRQLGFWVKNSLRDVVTPNLSSIYEPPPLSTEANVERSTQNRVTGSNGVTNITSNSRTMAWLMETQNKIPIELSINVEEDMEEEEPYLFPPCPNIDQAMFGLHTPLYDVNDFLLDRDSYVKFDHSDNEEEDNYEWDYDWLLDGDPEDCNDHKDSVENVRIEPKEGAKTKWQKREFGDLELDVTLADMELECSSGVTESDSLLMDEKEIWPDNVPSNPYGVFPSDTGVANSTFHKNSTQNFKAKDIPLELEVNLRLPKPSFEKEGTKTSNASLSAADKLTLQSLSGSTKAKSELEYRKKQSHKIPFSIEQPVKYNHESHLAPLKKLSLADTSTPEGRFTRRIQVELDLFDDGHSNDTHLNNENLVGSTSNNSVKGMIHKEKSHIEACETMLPPQYYTPNYDPIVDILRALPWQSNQQKYNYNNDTEYDDVDELEHLLQMDEYLTSTLSTLDEASTAITAELVSKINNREADIEEGMERIQEIMDVELPRATLCSAEGFKYLSRARGRSRCFESGGDCNWSSSGVLGGLNVIKQSGARKNLRDLNSVIKECEELIALEESIRSASDRARNRTESEWARLIRAGSDLKSRLMYNDRLAQLVCLDPLRKRVANVMDFLCREVEDSLAFFLSVRCRAGLFGCGNKNSGRREISAPATTGECYDKIESMKRKWSEDCSVKYGTMFYARLLLNDSYVQELMDNTETGVGKAQEVDVSDDDDIIKEKDREINHDPKKFPKSSYWSECILKLLAFEVDRCLARALLDPSVSRFEKEGVESSSSFDQNLIRIKKKINKIQVNDEDASSLRSLTHSLLVMRFEFEQQHNHLPGVYHKLCLLLTEVLHTHYLLTQWHRSPFDERNRDVHFMHRYGCAVDDQSQSDNTPENEPRLKNYNNDDKEKLRKEGQKLCDPPSHGSQFSISSNPTSIPSPKRSTQLQHNDKTDLPQTCVDVPRCISAPASESCVNNFCNRSVSEIDPIGDNEHLNDIYHIMKRSRLDLWKRCESVLVELLSFFSTKNDHSNGDTDIYTCFSNLESLHDVLQLSNQMICLSQEFLGPDISKRENVVPLLSPKSDQCILKGKLIEIFSVYLRGVRVEAMTELSAMLANEKWELAPLRKKTTECYEGSKVDKRIRQCTKDLLEEYSPDLAINSRKEGSQGYQCWKNHFHQRGAEFSAFFPNFVVIGNPFVPIVLTVGIGNDAKLDENMFRVAKEERRSVFSSFSGGNADLCDKISSVLGRDILEFPICTHSGINGLAKWTARILTVIKKLPIITNEAVHVLGDMYDLFFLTAFRFSVGNEESEKIVLGSKPRSDFTRNKGTEQILDVKLTSHGGRRPNSFGQSKRRNNKNDINRSRSNFSTQEFLPKHIEAEINAPLKSETQKLARLREYVFKGQDSLSGMVNFFKEEEWIKKQSNVLSHENIASLKKEETRVACVLFQNQIVASYSCIFLACLLDTASQYIRHLLNPTLIHSLLGGCSEQVEVMDLIESFISQESRTLLNYTEQIIEVSPLMCVIGCQMAAVRSIKGANVVREIISIGKVWDESNLKENCNGYVETLSERCTFLWVDLMCSCQKLPDIILSQAWLFIVESAYLTLLEGFSKVLSCSTEGRALMSIDLATLSNSLSEIGVKERLNDQFDLDIKLPPQSICSRGMQYVDMYIKVFYFPEEDAMKWISENRNTYHLTHLLALVPFIVGEQSRIDPHFNSKIIRLLKTVNAL